MNLEIRIPISPTQPFFRQIEYLLRSVRALNGATGTARIVVSVGADMEAFDIEEICPWSRGQVTWRWVNRSDFQRFSFHATGLDRFHAAENADIVLFCDADILFIRDLNDLLTSIAHTPAVAGLIAHTPPFLLSGSSGLTSWDDAFRKAGIPLPQDRYQHAGYGLEFHDVRHRFCPPYFNFGSVFVPSSLMEILRAQFKTWLPIALDFGWEYMSSQIALSFALISGNLPRLALPPRFNFPNTETFERGYPQEFAEIAILHYQRIASINRHRDLNDRESVERLIARRDLTGTNELFRHNIERLSPEIARES